MSEKSKHRTDRMHPGSNQLFTGHFGRTLQFLTSFFLRRTGNSGNLAVHFGLVCWFCSRGSREGVWSAGHDGRLCIFYAFALWLVLPLDYAPLGQGGQGTQEGLEKSGMGGHVGFDITLSQG